MGTWEHGNMGTWGKNGREQGNKDPPGRPSFVGTKNQKCFIAMFLHLVGTEVSGDNCKITLLRVGQMILPRQNRFHHVC